VSSKTSFDSKQPKMEPDLVSALSKQNVCFGCFGSLQKQLVSVFQLNQNNKKPTETNRKKQIDTIKIEA